MNYSEQKPGERPRRGYSFLNFTLDVDRATLCRENEEITLRPKSFEVLTYLVEHNGRLVTKAELTDTLWPDTAVMDNSLAQCIVEIRRALGDETQQLVRTVARRGYLFTPPVTTPVLDFPRQPQPSPAEHGPTPASPATSRYRKRSVLAAMFLVAMAAIAAFLVWLPRSSKPQRTHEQITKQ